MKTRKLIQYFLLPALFLSICLPPRQINADFKNTALIVGCLWTIGSLINRSVVNDAKYYENNIKHLGDVETLHKSQNNSGWFCSRYKGADKNCPYTTICREMESVRAKMFLTFIFGLPFNFFSVFPGYLEKVRVLSQLWRKISMIKTSSAYNNELRLRQTAEGVMG